MTSVQAPAGKREETAQTAFDRLLQRFAILVDAGVRSPATLDMHRDHAKYLLERIGPKTTLEQLTPSRIEAIFEAERAGRRRRVSNSTLNKRLSTLRQALQLAGRRRKLPSIPYRYTPRAEHLPDFEAYAAMRDDLPAHRRAWFVLATWTGQRSSDVERMLRDDLDCDQAWVMIRSTKTRQPARRFAAAPELVEQLAPRWRQLARGEKLVEAWPHATSALAKRSRRLGLPLTTPQRLRHTFFTWFVGANGFCAELLELGGWRDLTIPARVYAHAAPARLREQIQRMHDFVRAPWSPREVPTSAMVPAKEMGPTVFTAPSGPASHAEGASLSVAGSPILSVGPAGFEPAAYGLKVGIPVAEASSLDEREQQRWNRTRPPNPP